MTPALRFHIGCAATLFFLDAFVLDQGLVAGFVALVFLVRVVARRWRSSPWSFVLLRAFVYLACFVLVMCARSVNNRIADSRAASLIASVETFHSLHGSWPSRLEDAVSAVPRAKYTLTSSEFRYTSADGDAVLSYTDLPPFGTAAYDFKTREWHSLR